MDVGEIWVYTSTYTVTQADLDAGNDLVNLASVTSDQILTSVTDTEITPVKPFSWVLFTAAMLPPPCPDVPQYCYLVSDRDNEPSVFLDEGSNNSALVKYTFENNKLEFVGRLGVGSIEAITLSLDGTILYAVDSDIFGIIDTTPGNSSSFRPVNAAGLGKGYGVFGWVRFNDIDGLAFDPSTGILYGTHRLATYDLLLQINPATGTFVENAFGENIDYVVFGNNTEGATWRDLDDIAIDANGTMYGLANAQGFEDKLVVIDKKTGVVSNATNLAVNGDLLNDLEGLTFFSKNIFFGTTGVETSAQQGEYQNSFFNIELNPTTATKIIRLEPNFNGYKPYDFEAIACPVCLPRNMR